MAHFAELNETNTVINVIAISNAKLQDDDGIEQESLGIEFCHQLFGDHTRWRQTSYNNNFRVRYAGIGFTYDEILDAFIPPKRFNSWVLDPVTADWKAPFPAPDLTPEQKAANYHYFWDENLTQWILKQTTPPSL